MHLDNKYSFSKIIFSLILRECTIYDTFSKLFYVLFLLNFNFTYKIFEMLYD